MSRDDLTEIPSFAARRDEAVDSAPRNAIPGRSREVAGLGGASKFFLVLSFIAVCLLSAYAWYSYQLIGQLTSDQSRTGKQVQSLENLLTDTDETVTKSAAAMGAQLNLLDSEVRKLWDARKAANRKVSSLEKADKTADATLKTLKDNNFRQKKTLDALTADLQALQTLSADIERLAGSARQIQSDVERLADDVNRANLERASLGNRVKANEEWVASINGFRKQVNTNVNQLRTDIRQLSAQVESLAVESAPPSLPEPVQ
jgi:chromosome segregation ATPase